ncbi:MAG: EAL domain-containing protein [Burkholderiales bacterium]
MSEAQDTEASVQNAFALVDAGPFFQALRLQISARQADGEMLALLLLECGVIDRIDAVWGYPVGDAVRARVTSLLRAEVLRPGDLVAEIGRDEIACVLSGIGGEAVATMAAEKTLRVLKAPFWIGDDEIFADAAIGIAMFPAHGDQAEVLLQRAKNACVLARELPSRIAEFTEDSANPAAARLLHQNKLHAAVIEDSLDMIFQPQYDLRLGQMMGAACMLRWHDPALGVVLAEDAFVAAEAAGVVSNLVSSTLNRALRNISEFRYSAGLDLRVCVKIPARALLHAELADVVQRALGTWSLRAGRLILEIGETGVFARETQARQTLLRLKEIGVKLSIDDPSMALTSLFALASLPFQEIKIDVSALNDVSSAPKSEGILRSLVDLAHQLRLDVVAVGAANQAVAERLKALGCDVMQADYRGPAVDAKAFVEKYGQSDEDADDDED